MPKDRDWIDYASLASQVGQNIQLHGVKRELENISKSAAEQERLAEKLNEHLDEVSSAAITARLRQAEAEEENERQDNLRQNVFECAQGLKKIQAKILPADLRRALVMLQVNASPHATTADLKSFEDKERLQAVLDGISEAEKECRARLDAEGLAAAETCLQYLRDQDQLRKLISCVRRRDALRAKAVKLIARRQDQKNERSLRWQAELKAKSDRIYVLGQKRGIWRRLATDQELVTLKKDCRVLAGNIAGLSNVQDLPGAFLLALKTADENLAEGTACLPPKDRDFIEKLGANVTEGDYRGIFEKRVPLIKEVLGIDTTGCIEDDDKTDAHEDEDGGGDDDGLGDDGELYLQALDVLKTSRRASTSMLQRRLRIGFNRAVQIMEKLEGEGIVGPDNGSNPREILVDLDAM